MSTETFFEVVLNKLYLGEFELSKLAIERIIRKNNDPSSIEFFNYRKNRSDPVLIETVKELGTNASTRASDLRIVKIPIEYKGCIEYHENDGIETVVCDPAQLILSLLKQFNNVSLSPTESSEILQTLITLSFSSTKRF